MGLLPVLQPHLVHFHDYRSPTADFMRSAACNKQASKATGVRAFYWLGRGIIVSRQEVSGKVTYDAGGAKME